jgi:hypothetical protein
MFQKLIACTLLCLCAFLTADLKASSTSQQPHVLVIQSYHKEYPWDAGFLKGIRETLGNSARVTAFEMDTKRLPKETFSERAELAFAAYQEAQPDLVMVADDNATKMLADRISKTGTPVVFLGVNGDPRKYDLVGNPLVGGVLERPLVKRSIKSMQQIMPNKVEKALVLFDDSVTPQEVLQGQFKGEQHIKLAGRSAELHLTNDLTT